MELELGWNPRPYCSPRELQNANSLLVYNLLWLPRTHSFTFALHSLESEALQVILLPLLITLLTLARMEYVLHFYNSGLLFMGIFPLGSPSLLLSLSKSCSSFMTQLQRPSSWKSLSSNFSLLFFL